MDFETFEFYWKGGGVHRRYYFKKQNTVESATKILNDLLNQKSSGWHDAMSDDHKNILDYLISEIQDIITEYN